jgi:hypothetical protein
MLPERDDIAGDRRGRAGHDRGSARADLGRHLPGRPRLLCWNRDLAAGITSILNFAPVVLSVPPGVDVRKVDLSIELQILAFHAQRRAVVRVAPGEGAPVNGSSGVTQAMAA